MSGSQHRAATSCIVPSSSSSPHRKVAEVHAADGYRIDLHELRTAPQDTALVGIYAPVVMDLSDIGGRPNTTVYDYVVQEVDIATGAKLFE